MSAHVVTALWGNAWERYGRQFYETFRQFWPSSHKLTILTDRALPVFGERQIPLGGIRGYDQFTRDNLGKPEAHGRVHAKKLDEHGVSWRHDAMKWFPQALAPRDVMQDLRDGDILVWMDADVHAIDAVPQNWVSKILDGHDVACLQRPGTHSEIGFYALSVNDRTRAFVEEFADLYVSGRIYEFREWHSAFIFDRALAAIPGLTVKNLNPTGLKGHVWPHTELARYTVHKKGKRKDA